MKNTETTDSECKGFTLLELAITLVIVGLLMAGAMAAYTVHIQKEQVTRTKSNIETVNDAIAAFKENNGYYPCPARPNDPAAQSGIAGDQSDCSNAMGNGVDATTGMAAADVTDGGGAIVRDKDGTNPLRVRIGVVPVTVIINDGSPDERTVQLVSGDQAVDGWRNRIAYAVIEQMADPARVDDVNDDTGMVLRQPGVTGINIDQEAKFMVLSRGPDGVGAYSTTGTLRRPCDDGSDNDAENCDADSLFFSIGIDGTRSLSGDDNNFDDFVMGDGAKARLECKSSEEMRGFNMRTRQPICVAKDTMCYETGKAFVGLKADPTNPGGMIADCRYFTPFCPAGQVAAQGPNEPPKCVPNASGTCPAGNVVIGTNPDGTDQCGVVIPPVCTDGKVQVGFGEDGRPVCATKSEAVCPAHHFMIGGSIDSPKCGPVPSTCEGAGKVILGVRNGQLVCDTSLKDQACDPGDYIVAISAGQPVCGRPGGEPLYVQDLGVYQEHPAYDAGSLNVDGRSDLAIADYNARMDQAIINWPENNNAYNAAHGLYCKLDANGELSTHAKSDPLVLTGCLMMMCNYETGHRPSFVQLQGHCYKKMFGGDYDGDGNPDVVSCGGVVGDPPQPRYGFGIAIGCFYKM